MSKNLFLHFQKKGITVSPVLCIEVFHMQRVSLGICFSFLHQMIGNHRNEKVFKEFGNIKAPSKSESCFVSVLFFKRDQEAAEDSLSNKTSISSCILCWAFVETWEVNLKFLRWIRVSVLKESRAECEPLALGQAIDHEMALCKHPCYLPKFKTSWRSLSQLSSY